ncbi:MAG: Eco57I restriction-modification methylase domain-containing protein, partial [Nannocystaceae bacterium]
MTQVAQAVFEKWQSQLIGQLGTRGYLEFMATHHDAVIEALAPLAGVQVSRRVQARLDANAKAREILEASDNTEEDLQALAEYSGAGGLPTEGLEGTHGEYYTPTRVAEAIGVALAPFLPALAVNGTVCALEPGAGIGRLIAGVEKHASTTIQWTAVEKSPTASKILRTLHPNVDVHGCSLEEYIAKHGAELQGKLRLVVANPPFYTRDLTDEHDKDPAYREERSFAYFLRRTLDLLSPGGLGVFIVPNTFLSWTTYQPLRERVLKRHELLGATRLRSKEFPGVKLGTDIVFFRRRSGDVTEFSVDEQATIEGEYFKSRPDRFAVEEGGSLRLHDLDIPLVAEPAKPPRSERTPPGPSIVAAASAFGRRLHDVRTKIAMRDPVAHGLWTELRRDIDRFLWAAKDPNPWQWSELADQADDGVQYFLDAFTAEGSYSAWFALAPSRMQYRGSPDNLVDQAIWLYEQSKFVRFAELFALHRRVGGTQTEAQARVTLANAGWVYRGESIRPGEPATSPVPLEDVEVSPLAGWIPLGLLSQWVTEVTGSTVELERRDGLVVPVGIAYERLRDLVSDEVRWLLGFLNFDGRYFRPLGPPPGQARKGSKTSQWRAYWTQHFTGWVRSDPQRRTELATAYNRTSRTSNEAPTGSLHIPRWTGDLTLHDYQARAVRRFVDAQQGLLALGTGLGKTYIAAAVIAS